jgi:hypothetical protein
MVDRGGRGFEIPVTGQENTHGIGRNLSNAEEERDSVHMRFFRNAFQSPPFYPLMGAKVADSKLRATNLSGLAEIRQNRFALLVDQQWNWWQNRVLERRLSKAKLRHRASLEDVGFRTPRGLDRTLVRSLSQESAWVPASRRNRRPGSNRNHRPPSTEYTARHAHRAMLKRCGTEFEVQKELMRHANVKTNSDIYGLDPELTSVHREATSSVVKKLLGVS